MQIKDDHEFDKAITAQGKLYKMWKEGELSFKQGRIHEVMPRAAKILGDYGGLSAGLSIDELDKVYDLLTIGIKEYLQKEEDIDLLRSKYKAKSKGTVPFDELLEVLAFVYKI